MGGAGRGTREDARPLQGLRKKNQTTPLRSPLVPPAADVDNTLTELVVEEIRRVAKDRANGMTLDSPIVETGMDSLERMEIVASLEEKFGGRFPEEVLPELETIRQLVAAVEKYLGTQPRPASSAARGRQDS